MGQLIGCCFSVDTISVDSLQDCTLQESTTNTVKTHPLSTSVGGEKVKERKKRSCEFLCLVRRAGKKIKKTSSGQVEKEEQCAANTDGK